MSDVNTLSGAFETYNASAEVHYGDWDDYSYLPNGYFDKESSCYSKSKELYSQLQTVAFNNFGVPLEYYVVDYNTSYNTVFNEDNDRTIIRNFECMAFYELPHEDYEASLFGLYELDTFHVYISKEYFAWASTYHNGLSAQYSSITPKEGDLFRTSYNNHFYEVMLVKQQTEQFLQQQHSYDLVCRIAKNQHYNVSATVVSASNVTTELLANDILDSTSAVDSLKSSILYTSSVSEGSLRTNNPFGDW